MKAMRQLVGGCREFPPVRLERSWGSSGEFAHEPKLGAAAPRSVQPIGRTSLFSIPSRASPHSVSFFYELDSLHGYTCDPLRPEWMSPRFLKQVGSIVPVEGESTSSEVSFVYFTSTLGAKPTSPAGYSHTLSSRIMKAYQAARLLLDIRGCEICLCGTACQRLPQNWKVSVHSVAD